MKNYVRFLLILLSGIIINMPMYAQDHAKKKVAVYMIGNTNDIYKKVIGAKMVSAIVESGEYIAVERTADFLAALSAENDYGTSGEVRDSQIAAIGQKFGVKYVAVADVCEVFDEFFVSARLINVETGMVERAYDTSGPAESMNQLMELSKNVAVGLFNGIYDSKYSPHTPIHYAPIHLSLCVMDNRNGKIQYFTAEQWQKMSEETKLNYKKQGVVIADNGEAFLIAMRETGAGSLYWAQSNCKLPNKWQLELIFKHKESLNTVLRVFGGEQLYNETYWTNETSEDRFNRYACTIDFDSGGINPGSGSGNDYRARAVTPMPVE